MTPQEIVADFRKKYEGTYVFVEMPDKPNEDNLFHMSEVVAVGSSGVMKLQSEEYGKIQLNLSTQHTIKFLYPKMGVHQCGKDAHLVLREPKRQWSRGLCAGNCSIRNVAAGIVGGRAVRSAEHLTFTNVAAAFAGLTYTYGEAVQMLASGKYRSVALGDGFSLMLSTITAYDTLLMYWTSPVAGIMKGEIKVLENTMAKQIGKVVSK